MAKLPDALKGFFGTFTGLLSGFSSYRIITAIEQSNIETSLKHIRRRRSYFKLSQVQTNFSPLHVACIWNLPQLVDAMLDRKDAAQALNSQDNPVGMT